MKNFATTHWTRVLQSQGDSTEAGDALAELCEIYYAPVEGFIHHSAWGAESASDLTQEFFQRVLSGRAFKNAAPERGRFRSFLLGAVKHFLADVATSENAQKRGGGEKPVSLSGAPDTESEVPAPDRSMLAPDQEFDRQWALTLLARALKTLEGEFEAEGQGERFKVLQPWLTGETGEMTQADAAEKLGVNTNAIKVAIHRLRRRFREIVKSEIRGTVDDSSEVDQELRELIELFSR